MKVRIDMDVERLIKEVCKFPVLYDQSHEKYRNSEYKDKVWKNIASSLEAQGGVEECKKKWASIRDQLRRTMQKRKSISGQAIRHYKYKHEDLLEFLIPHVSEREAISNVSYSQELEDELEEQKFILDAQEEESIVDEKSVQLINMEEELMTENRGTQTVNMTKSSQLCQTSSASSFATSIERDSLVKPLLKRKRQCEVNSTESVSSQLIAYIMAEKEIGKHSKGQSLETAEQNPVDAFLAGIAPPLKSLNPILFNQAKGGIFAIVQEFEMKQLMGNKD